MERLTHKARYEAGYKANRNVHDWECVDKLGQLEDLEEQGKLPKLPCAVGDTVYVKMQSGEYAEADVRDFTYFLTCGFCIVVTSDKFDKQNIPFSEFGKTVFLSREESEAALKKFKMRVYISGKITGTNDFMERFKEVEDRLTKEGMSVINPAHANSYMPKDTTYEEYMNVSFCLLDMCEAIYMMNGWEASCGANREYGYALAKDKIIMFEKAEKKE